MSTGSQMAHTTMGHMAIAPKIVVAAETLNPEDILVHAATTGAITLTMPEGGDALAGVVYIVRLEIDGGNLTIAFPGAGADPSDIVLTAAHDFAAMMTDGTYWYVLGEIST